MGFENGVIMKPIAFSDIQKALGTGKNRLGDLCRHDNINKWSMYKPVRYKKLFSLVRDKYENDKPADDFFKANYGLKLPEAVSITGTITLAKLQKVIDSDWIYDKPEGTINSPFRIEDFEGYDVNAKPYLVVRGFTVNLADYNDGEFVEVICDENTDNGSIPFTRLNITELANNRNLYLWMFAFRDDGSQLFMVRAEGNITSGEDGLLFRILASRFKQGAYNLYYVYGDDDRMFYPIPDSPNQQPQRLVVRAQSIESFYIKCVISIGYSAQNTKSFEEIVSGGYSLYSSFFNYLYVKVQFINADPDRIHSFDVSDIRFKNMDTGYSVWAFPKATKVDVPANGSIEKNYEIDGDSAIPVIFGDENGYLGDGQNDVTRELGFVRGDFFLDNNYGTIRCVRGFGDKWG